MTTCRLCLFLRAFLPLAAMLILAIGLLPEIATPFGPLVPTPLGVALIVPVIGVPGFIIKYWLWRRSAR